ncbi:alkyl sulfatase C-terminal domain-containing protein [Streptomyces longwoodensis]|uniref:alkyl sulfatase C-terminal domain-containing protein n=1 Tax=Streptomyces longwoodensis TaxID=68231 RepID=UPI00368EDAC7
MRVNGPRAGDHTQTVLWRFTDPDRTHRTSLRDGVLVHHPVTGAPGPVACAVRLRAPPQEAVAGLRRGR